MWGAAFIGVFSAAVVAGIAWGQNLVSGISPAWILLLSALIALAWAWGSHLLAGESGFEGLAELFHRIHSPSTLDRPGRWALHALTSAMLALLGTLAGVEGAAIEASYGLAVAFRHRSARWFESRRRSDVACAVSAGISAGFGAPLTAIIFPIEIGIGGRTLYSALSSLVAFAAVAALSPDFPTRALDLSGSLYTFGFSDWKEWLGILGVGAFCGLAGAFISGFVRYSHSQLISLFHRPRWGYSFRILTAGIVICAVFTLYRPGFDSLPKLLEQVLDDHVIPSEAGLIAVSRIFLLALTLAGFGTSGIFWPLVGIGGILGWGVNSWIYGELPGFSATAGLAGVAGLLSSVLGAPISATVLAFELGHSPQLIAPCLAAAWIARAVSRLVWGRRLIEMGLEARGLRLSEGRSIPVLESILVKDAMVTDYEVVFEYQSLGELKSRFESSRYPFFPVIRAQKGRSNFAGMLTFDMVQEAWHAEHERRGRSGERGAALNLLEVKDLLYRYGEGSKLPISRPEQRISEVASMLERYPFLPVVDLDGNLVGLLLGSEVRLCYDREVARRSLELATGHAEG